MGVNVGRNDWNLSCDYCQANETEKYYVYDMMILIETRKGWRKDYITGRVTCPDCVKKQNDELLKKNNV